MPAVPRRAAAGPVPAELGSCAAEGEGKAGRPPTGAALSGGAGALSPAGEGRHGRKKWKNIPGACAFGTLKGRFCPLNTKEKKKKI